MLRHGNENADSNNPRTRRVRNNCARSGVQSSLYGLRDQEKANALYYGGIAPGKKKLLEPMSEQPDIKSILQLKHKNAIIH